MNVIIQAIAASSKTTEWLRANASSSSKMFDTLYKLTSLINRIGLEDIEEEDIDELASSSTAQTNTNSINDELTKLDTDQNEFNGARVLKRALNAHNWKVRTEEHDCHELFHLVMSVLDDELNEKIRSQKSLNFFKQQQQQRIGIDSSLPLIVPHNPFHGYLAIQLQCLDCSYKVDFLKFLSLRLTIT